MKSRQRASHDHPEAADDEDERKDAGAKAAAQIRKEARWAYPDELPASVHSQNPGGSEGSRAEAAIVRSQDHGLGVPLPHDEVARHGFGVHITTIKVRSRW